MRKKSRSHKKKAKKKLSLLQYFKRYFIFLFVGIVFFAGTTTLRANQTQPTCANSKSCTSDLSERIDNNTKGIFHGKVVIPPNIDITNETAVSPVLGTSTASGEKHIYIDLSKQRLYAYQGTTQVFAFRTATGKWGRTPVGNFHIWERLRATLMAGGEGPDAYYLPNVPYVMYFHNDFGIHGTYWHDNFGTPMSHGCVNLRTIDAKALFEWADGPMEGKPGTPVSICNQITDSNQCIQDNPIL